MNSQIRQLETEAEAARAKLATDLAILRSPSTYSEFKDGLKQEAMDAKDAVVESVRSNVRNTADIWIDDIKAKAAANPTAALLIGAGVAWRLLKDPPIATALVGAGLISLFRTSPEPRLGGTSDAEYLELAKQRLKEQASDLAISATQRATEVAASAKGGVTEAAESAKQRAAEFGGDIKRQADDWQEFAAAKTREWRDAASAASSELRAEFVDKASAAAEYSQTTARQGYTTLQRAAYQVDDQHRDKLLLGAAGIAVTAALTLALQRRISAST